jgi:eukaryotic-like serine/threonine-protein kinase
MATRYVLHDSIGSGGMATVHIGQLHAPLGFTRVVAIKRLHPALSHQPQFAAMLVDEARITARVRHLNVIPTLDVFLENSECFLVMEYVEGESLAKLLRSASQARVPVPLGVVSAVLSGVLHGLHAAHIAKSGSGEPLNIIHRDVSPQNILVGTDGIARVFDFGVAKALGRLQQTRAGEFKGKLPYLAPEQFSDGAPDRRVDVYAASVTLWETLTTRRLFDGGSEEEVFSKILQSVISPPSELRPDVPPALDALVLRGLSRAASARFATTEEMAWALEQAVPPAAPRQVSQWLRELAGEALAKRAALVTEMDGVAAPLPSAPRSLPAATGVVPATAPVLAAPTDLVPTLASAAPPSPASVSASDVVLPEARSPSVTARMTLRMQTPAAARVDAPTLVEQRPTALASVSSAPPLGLPTAEPSGRRRLAVRGAIGAVILLCSVAAPAFGWMALKSRDEPPQATTQPVVEVIHVAPSAPSLALAPSPDIALPTLDDAAATASAPKLVKEASPVAAAKSEPARPVGKAKPAASGGDYLSSPPFSQRR